MPDQQVFIRPLHVVHIDDSAVGTELVRAILAQSQYPKYIVHSFSSIKAAEDTVVPSAKQIDAVILDLMLVESEGRDTFLHAISIFSLVPIVILTGTQDIDLAYSLIYAGADSFLIKDMMQQYLPLFVSSAVARRNRPGVNTVQVAEAFKRLQEIAAKHEQRQQQTEDHHDHDKAVTG